MYGKRSSLKPTGRAVTFLSSLNIIINFASKRTRPFVRRRRRAKIKNKFFGGALFPATNTNSLSRFVRNVVSVPLCLPVFLFLR